MAGAFGTSGRTVKCSVKKRSSNCCRTPLFQGYILSPSGPNNTFWEARLNSGDQLVLLPDGDMAWVMDVISHDEIKLWGKK